MLCPYRSEKHTGWLHLRSTDASPGRQKKNVMLTPGMLETSNLSVGSPGPGLGWQSVYPFSGLWL